MLAFAPGLRAAAKKAGESHYFTGKPCKNGHNSKRHTASGHCLECIRTRLLISRAADPQYFADYSAEYRKNNLERVRSWKRNEYLRHGETIRLKRNLDYQANPEPQKIARRLFRLNNSERTNAAASLYRANNPEKVSVFSASRRARVKNAPGIFFESDIRQLISWQKGKCAYCPKLLGDGFHVDHIEPLSRGGSNWPENLQLCCQTCNLRKNARDPFEFLYSFSDDVQTHWLQRLRSRQEHLINVLSS